MPSTPTSTENGQPRRSSFLDPTALMQIKSLSLRAKAVVDGFTSGLHRSPLRGFSVEFAEYRPYSVGDDLRNLDWKLLARTDRYYVKQFEDETNRRSMIAVDHSKSMQYGSGEFSKAEYARTLAATLAYFLSMQRDAVGAFSLGGTAKDFIPPRTRKGHLQQIFDLLARTSERLSPDLAASLEELAALSKRRGLVIILSDFLTELEPLFQPLGYLLGRGHDIVAIRILDRNEIDFQLPSSGMLRDLESGKDMYIDPGEARATYRKRFTDHESRLADICHRRGARLLTVATDMPLEVTLLELISGRRTLLAEHCSAPDHATSKAETA